LQEDRLTGREFRQNQVPQFANFSLKNMQILDFSQSTILAQTAVSIPTLDRANAPD
jgi:hypothetical protein